MAVEIQIPDGCRVRCDTPSEAAEFIRALNSAPLASPLSAASAAAPAPAPSTDPPYAASDSFALQPVSESIPTKQQLLSLWDGSTREIMRDALRIFARSPRHRTKAITDELGISSLSGIFSGLSKRCQALGFDLRSCYSARNGVLVFKPAFHTVLVEAIREADGKPMLQ